jgi:hypothetical protein
MQDAELEKLRYPLGRRVPVTRYDGESVARCIQEIEMLPAKLAGKVSGLSDADLDKRYRPGGWTVRQVVHHLCDSHMNAYIRFKWAQTEDRPLIKAYDEKLWAELPDGRTGGIESSLRLLETLHAKWIVMLKGMDETAFHKSYIHPDGNKLVYLFDCVEIYAWHGRQHLAHIGLALA